MSAAAPPFARFAATGVGRIVLGGCLLAVVALIVLGGSGALRGTLGSLFGFHQGAGAHGQAHAPNVSAIVAQGPALQSAARRRASAAPVKRQRRAHAHRRAQRQVGAGPGAPTLPRPPAPPPPPGNGPPPGSGPGAVGALTDTVSQAAQALPAPVQPTAQPVVQTALSTVASGCTVLGGCP